MDRCLSLIALGKEKECERVYMCMQETISLSRTSDMRRIVPV